MPNDLMPDAKRGTYAFKTPDLPAMPKMEMFDAMSREELWQHACLTGYRVAFSETRAALSALPAQHPRDGVNASAVTIPLDADDKTLGEALRTITREIAWGADWHPDYFEIIEQVCAALHSRAAQPAQKAQPVANSLRGIPCAQCGVLWEKHGTYPTCATHHYTATVNFRGTALATPLAASQDERDAKRLRFLIERLPPGVFADREVSSPESWRDAVDAAIAAQKGPQC